MVGDRFFRHIYSACWDPEVRLQEMDRDGIDDAGHLRDPGFICI